VSYFNKTVQLLINSEIRKLQQQNK